ncbi:MAG: hypothetical protein CDV28_12324 [Candidatus Electronema aureum]|uniref:Uncharacterized protein n=1 Tax=Candidatus Electronema aureum TaxID=2005002 RepID=A0A521G0N6_9BACT|nr:MAG: hypothetical protein CDV28_12324 [Candidatus Electronema aureum]
MKLIANVHKLVIDVQKQTGNIPNLFWEAPNEILNIKKLIRNVLNLAMDVQNEAADILNLVLDVPNLLLNIRKLLQNLPGQLAGIDRWILIIL